MRLKIGLVFMLVLLLFSGVPVSALNNSTKLSESDIKQLKVQIETNSLGKNLTHKIDTQKTNSVISQLLRKGVSELSIYSVLLNDLGYSFEEITQNLIDEFAIDLDQGITITTTESYVKSNIDESVIELSKVECMGEVLDALAIASNNSESTNLLVYSTTSNDGYKDEISSDSYMRIITKSTYLDPAVAGGIGWYILSGTYTWLIMPNSRLIDAFSIYGENMVLSDVTSEIYSTVDYKKKVTDVTPTGTTTSTTPYTSTKTTADRSVSSAGVYYKWDLPNNSSYTVTIGGQTVTHTETITYLSYYIRTKAQRQYPTLPTPFNVFTRYSHCHPAVQINPSFGWTTDPTHNSNIGVSASFTLTIDYTNYSSFNYTYYTP